MTGDSLLPKPLFVTFRPLLPPMTAWSKSTSIRGNERAGRGRQLETLDRGDRDCVWMLHQSLHNVFEEALHGGGQAGAAALAAFLIKLATVSLGWAPLLIQ